MHIYIYNTPVQFKAWCFWIFTGISPDVLKRETFIGILCLLPPHKVFPSAKRCWPPQFRINCFVLMSTDTSCWLCLQHIEIKVVFYNKPKAHISVTHYLSFIPNKNKPNTSEITFKTCNEPIKHYILLVSCTCKHLHLYWPERVVTLSHRSQSPTQ